ncbi:MAG: flavodoxin family protein [Clostridia bacterium]|nr:flavodoxin family protein [Clostridia bacterium]
MKQILLVNGSPNRDGNTASALRIMEDVFLAQGLTTAWCQIGRQPVRGCQGCGHCAKNHRCVFPDDVCNDLIAALLQSDAVVIGTPVYFAGPNGALCALLDRVFYATANFGQMLQGKPAAAVATCWRAGATPSIDRINKYFTFAQMPVVSSTYWNGYLGPQDAFGRNVLETLAHNMTKLLGKE